MCVAREIKRVVSTVFLLQLTIVLRMDDKMNRHLTSCITQTDSPKGLAQELVHYGFINEVSSAFVRVVCLVKNVESGFRSGK